MASNISSHSHPWAVVATGFDPTRTEFAGSADIDRAVSCKQPLVLVRNLYLYVYLVHHPCRNLS